jgi:hypothetical protein
MRDPTSSEENINYLISLGGYRIRHLSQSECLGIMTSIVIEMFAESNPTVKDNSKDLGLMAINLVCYLTSFGDDKRGELSFKLIECLPHLAVYGLIEEQFLKFKNEAGVIRTRN